MIRTTIHDTIRFIPLNDLWYDSYFQNNRRNNIGKWSYSHVETKICTFNTSSIVIFKALNYTPSGIQLSWILAIPYPYTEFLSFCSGWIDFSKWTLNNVL